MWHTDRGRLLRRTASPVALGLAYVPLVETNPFSKLVVIFTYYALRISLGTLSIFLVIGFVGRNYDNVLMETGKFSGNLRVTENVLVTGVDRDFKSSNSTFQKIRYRHNSHGKSVVFDILFLWPPSIMILKLWCHEMRLFLCISRFLSFWLRKILRLQVCHNMATSSV